MARQVLEDLEYAANDDLPFIWMPLPEPWRAGQFSTALRRLGVLVRTADHFAVGRSAAPHAIRISLNTPQTADQLVVGLRILKSLLHNPPAAPMDP
jgi:DNA-binding transcriptional MocR family regulator